MPKHQCLQGVYFFSPNINGVQLKSDVTFSSFLRHPEEEEGDGATGGAVRTCGQQDSGNIGGAGSWPVPALRAEGRFVREYIEGATEVSKMTILGHDGEPSSKHKATK